MDADSPVAGIAGIEAPHEVVAPARQTLPLVFASPHSGNRYPRDFLAASKLDHLALRRSEDSFVDEIFQAAPGLGAPLIRALFPRAFVDPNREPFELDPAMFEDDLPSYANTRSPRVAAGLGTIARVVANGADIYRRKLAVGEALERIRNYYWPYHEALRDLVEATRGAFGYCVLIDCHSMPSVGGPADRDPGAARVDFVLGDCHGTACGAVVMETAAAELARLGYNVARNAPYSGGFVTRHYGRPAQSVHALQIEINRALYMDEGRIRRGAHLPRLAEEMHGVIAALGRIDGTLLGAQ
ncbi:MAG: N-formylglutamate amidohydrolase [Rhodospirillales bacterium]|nr:N-formylglutamate amidohydrolase [Rhodospirillales bacterium]MDH3909661.1 N-formylglutamate amidohydrolase [Rhodospirillales bacterium]MDH3918475.1 N-formylglutamate amidohydrolase [Rhodospirillales bacterium]MDH3965744.1 N-formylglutamate amidohydrolase [Rhodospirillales bacterium]